VRAPWRRGSPATADPDGATAEAAPAKVKRPLYPRVLRLRHVHPNGWQRAVLGEGALAVAALLVLADVASAWTLLALPLAVAGVVKAHDLLAGLLQRPLAEPPQEPPAEGSTAPDPAPDPVPGHADA
jgi:hypothetical protein